MEKNLSLIYGILKNEKQPPTPPQAPRYREENGGCQRWRMGKMCEGGQKAQTSGYKISHGDVVYSMATVANITVLHN